MIVGRQGDIHNIMQNLKRRQNTLVLGAAGIGKTALLCHIAEVLGERAYYIAYPSPAKAALQEAYATIADLDDEAYKALKIHQWTLNRLTHQMVQLVAERDDFVLIMDALDRITVASSEWLTVLAESSITLIGACRLPKESRQLQRFFWTFKKVDLKPLSDAEIKEIIQDQAYPPGQSAPAIRFKDKQTQRYFVERVIKAAKSLSKKCHKFNILFDKNMRNNAQSVSVRILSG